MSVLFKTSWFIPASTIGIATNIHSRTLNSGTEVKASVGMAFLSNTTRPNKGNKESMP